MSVSQTIKEQFEQANTIAIFGHQSIDGDAIGSMFWLGLQLKKLWKQVSYFTPDQQSQNFDFLDLSSLEYTFDYGEYDLLVFVDFSGYGRIKKFTEGHLEYFEKHQKVIIDHHPFDHDFENALIFRDESAISASELVFELTNDRWDLMDREVVTFLFMGILTDSGRFSYDEGKESIRVMHIATALLEYWVEKKMLIQHLFYRTSFEEVQFSNSILERIQKNGDILFSWYPLAELQQFNLHPDSSDSALYTMVAIKWYTLVILGKETREGIKISLRGRGKYDCNIIATHFWGGGHFNAAGCTITSSGNLEKDMYDFVEEVKKLF